MAEYSANQVTITNGFKAVVINSGESPENVRQGDFLFVTGSDPVAINRTYINDNDQHVIELTKNWGQGNKNNQPAIVIPSTAEYKAVADALKNANLLVNDNFVAMQDWQTKTGTVTFVNINGTTTTVKTLKQIESEAQAQLDTYHPYPWAMRKAEFNALRKANLEKYASSGFVSYGLDSHPLLSESNGLYSSSTVPEHILLGRSKDFSSHESRSKSPYPVVHIVGALFDIRYLGARSAYHLNQIRFPSPERGLRTYDSSNGIVTEHATPEIAFASETDTNKVITSREDMWGFEVFIREIKESDPFVYDSGLIQSQAAFVSGVPTRQDNVRPASYFAWFEGQTSNSKGLGVDWFNATEQEKISMASDSRNKIFFDDETGKFYQFCLRARTFAGTTNEGWHSIDSNDSSTTYASPLMVDGYSVVKPQGALNSIDKHLAPFDQGVVGSFANKNNRTFSDNYDFNLTLNINDLRGVFSAVQSGSQAAKNISVYDSECYFLVCGTINRLNQGAYHPAYNPQGARPWRYNPSQYSYVGYWYSGNALEITTRQQCFVLYTHTQEQLGASAYGGDVANGASNSGRLDKRFFDVIYLSGAGGIARDMRYSALPLDKPQIEKRLSSILSGEYRGVEDLTWSFIKTAPWLGAGSSPDSPRQYAVFNASNTLAIYVDHDELALSHGDQITVIDKTLGRVFVGTVNSQGTQGSGFTSCSGSPTYEIINGERTHVSFANNLYGTGNDVYVVVSQKSGIKVSGEYLNVDVLAEPEELLLANDFKNGWYGGYICPSTEGQNNEVQLNKPLVGVSDKPRLYSENQGVNWTLVSAAPNFVNSVMFSAVAAQGTGIEVYSYTTQAKLTQETIKSNIYARNYGVEAIKLLINYLKDNGAILQYSLTGNIAKDDQFGTYGGVKDISLKSFSWGYGSQQFAGVQAPIYHGDLALQNPSNNSRATKILPQVFVKDNQVFINFTFNELIHNGETWGDNGYLRTEANQNVDIDDNGDLFLSGHAQVIEPIGWIKNDK